MQVNSVARAGGDSAALRKSLAGLAIGLTTVFVSRGLAFGQQIVLARLLEPPMFGTFSLLLTAIGLASLVPNLRGAEAVIHGDPDEGLLQTAFTTQIVAGLAVMLLMVTGAPFIAGALGIPESANLVVAMSILVLLPYSASLPAPLTLPSATLDRRLDFFAARLPEVLNVVVGAVVAVALAFLGAGVWSMVVGLAAGAVMQVILLWRMTGFRPRLRIEGRYLRMLIGFGGPLQLSHLVSWVYLNVDNFYVGKILGTDSLGYYYVAFAMASQVGHVRAAVSRVAFPSFSAFKERPEALARVYSLATRYTTLLALSIALVTIPFAPRFLALLFGERWLAATQAFQFLTVAAVVRTSLGYSGDLLVSLGQTRIVLWAAAATAAIVVVLGPIALLSVGIAGMAAVVLFSLLVAVTISVAGTSRCLEVSYSGMLAGPLFAFSVVFVPTWLAREAAASPVSLVVLSSLALTAYFALYAVLFDRGGACLLGRRIGAVVRSGLPVH